MRSNLELEAIKKEVVCITNVEVEVAPPPYNAGYGYVEDDEDYYYCNYGNNPNKWPRN